MEFIETPIFTKYLPNYLEDKEFKELQNFLLISPEAGDVISQTGGFRKLRWSQKKRGKGKRGGLRIIYYYFPENEQIWLMTIYDKDEAIDLTSDQKKALKAAIEKEKKPRLVRNKKR